MKLRAKLFLSFLVIIFIALIIGGLFIFRLANISQVVNQELSPVVSDLSKASYLNSSAQMIRYYDEVLTQSARNYAFTGGVKWKDRYYGQVVDLDKKIKEAISKGGNQDKLFFQSIEQSNLVLVALEERSLALVDAGKSSEAIAILESDEYWRQKGIYKNNLDNYLSRSGQTYEQVDYIFSDNLDKSLAKVQSVVATTMIIYIIGIIVGTLASLLICWLIVRFIFNTLLEFKIAAQAIAQGNINKRITVNSNDEFGEMATAFNKMADSLRNSLADTEKKVTKRTADLEKINKTMVGRELKMVELKKEINELKNNK